MSIIDFDVQTLIGMLFWANLTSLTLTCGYVFCHREATAGRVPWSIIQAKSLLAVAFLLVDFRYQIPDILSVNLANTLLLLGFFAEARTILLVNGDGKSALMRATLWIAVVSVVLYNLITAFLPATGLRITLSSVAVFATLVVPTAKLLLCPTSTTFKRLVGFFYLMFIALLLPRGVFFMTHPESSIFTNSLIQVLSFTSLMLLTIFSLPAFLLLMKEDADKRLREMAQTDFLTGLRNRQSFLATAAVSLERHRREQTSCSVVFMDLDHFKRVNDTYGHAFGDAVLVAVADVLRTTVRGYDLACRYGGEEFAAFIDSPDPGAGYAMAERIRRRVAALRLPERREFSFTISVGVAIGVPAAADSLTTFLDAADATLYEAKETGRNKVVTRRMVEMKG